MSNFKPTVFVSQDLSCPDCKNEFINYNFEVELVDGSTTDGFISCPSCGGGRKEISLLLPPPTGNRIEDYTCPDCGTSGDPLAQDCCDTCIVKFYTRDADAPPINIATAIHNPPIKEIE